MSVSESVSDFVGYWGAYAHKNEDDLKNKDDLKNEDDFKNEDGRKNQYNIKNEDDLKNYETYNRSERKLFFASIHSFYK